jgi:hypothetical protein
VFGLPGLGQLAVQSVTNQDLPVIIGIVLLAAAFIVVANIVVDAVYAVLDPTGPVGLKQSWPSYRGSRTWTRAPPRAEALSAVTVPPCASTSAATIASPRPAPDSSAELDRPRSARANRSNARARMAGAKPGPSSATSITVVARLA